MSPTRTDYRHRRAGAAPVVTAPGAQPEGVGSVAVVTMRSAGDADDYWRRPPADAGRATPPAADVPEPTYTGPPPTHPPPRGWRTPQVMRPAPPRVLPGQDLPGLDYAERGARTVTLGIGMIAGAIMLILSCLLCSRVLF